MVSSNDTIIVKIANSIVSKINTLIGNHNSSNTAHSDIRNSIPTTTSQLTNNSGFLTSHQLFDAIYPVGSIYMSVNNTSPSILFGGTWQQLEDTFLYATSGTADTGYQATAGEATHTLTIDEMPSHTHNIQIWSHKNSGNASHNRATWDKATGDLIIPTTAGGGQAHNNMPPYMKVYMWKRTA